MTNTDPADVRAQTIEVMRRASAILEANGRGTREERAANRRCRFEEELNGDLTDVEEEGGPQRGGGECGRTRATMTDAAIALVGQALVIDAAVTLVRQALVCRRHLVRGLVILSEAVVILKRAPATTICLVFAHHPLLCQLK